MTLLIASERSDPMTPPDPEIGGSEVGGGSITYRVPAGLLHVYLDGAHETLCRQSLGGLVPWPHLAWPGGLVEDEHCAECWERATPD